MTPKTYFFAFLLIGCWVTDAGSQSNSARNLVNPAVFVGSTPCDSLIKSLLHIPADMKCDFIRWELTLANRNTAANTFALHIIYGVAQPNTLGFKGGGEKRSYKGAYTIHKRTSAMPKGVVYQLTTEMPSTVISLVELNDNLFHLLTPSGKLMVGNGGWSYTLNRKEVINTISLLPALVASSTATNHTSPQVIFDGRTPCQNFAAEHQMNVGSSCFKLKWRLILNRDPASHKPTTYIIRKVVDNLPRDVSGKWTIITGTQGNPDAIIYKLDPDDPQKSISFFVGDDNVLFFLNRDYNLYVGNSDFSFTLNKKQ